MIIYGDLYIFHNQFVSNSVPYREQEVFRVIS